jgi:CheY-like chemotaxis protein
MKLPGARILVVDDSRTIRRAFEFILAPQGFDLEFAADGKQAIALAVERLPDLVLLDYVLPDMRGSDVCGALAAHPATANIPVILVSARGASIRGSYLDAPNVVSFVAKPFKPEAILSVVHAALDRRRESQTPEGAPKAMSTETAIDRSASLDEGFGLLLSQLEQAALELADAPARGTVADSLRDLRAKIDDISHHIRGEGVAPYRLRPDGSLAGLASTLLETHRLLCRATLALTTGKAGIGRRPPTPRTIAIGVAGEAHCEEFLAIARSHPDVLVVDRDFGTIPWLTKLIDPALVVVMPSELPEVHEALSRLPDSRARRVVLAGPEDCLGAPWEDFEKVDPREALGVSAPQKGGTLHTTLEVLAR